MSLKALNAKVQRDLSFLSFGGSNWVRPHQDENGHVYDVVIIGGGQSGLAAAFGLLRERISNILVLDENPEGTEGPWETYARMVTLRTPKHLPSIDLGIPSLTFRSWWEAQFGPKGWDLIDKIPRGDWMNYLRWYRNVLNLPVQNQVKLNLIEPLDDGIHRLHVEGSGALEKTILTKKVILATGIQGGGEWHVPSLVSDKLPKCLYAHTSEEIDFSALKGKKVAVLGGGASAFDNAHFALTEGVSEAHVFVRRKEMQRINPIRQMERSGLIERYHVLPDAEKYRVMSHFFNHSQAPTNDTFSRASSWPGFHLHLGTPWLDVDEDDNGAVVTTPNEKMTFDYLIISTGLVTDPALRPELRLVEPYITRWSDRYRAPDSVVNPMIDSHPYLTPGFALQSHNDEGRDKVYGIFTYNYSALISNGILASALSGMRFGIPKLVSAVADELFLDQKDEILDDYFNYQEHEFVADLPTTIES